MLTNICTNHNQFNPFNPFIKGATGYVQDAPFRLRFDGDSRPEADERVSQNMYIKWFIKGGCALTRTKEERRKTSLHIANEFTHASYILKPSLTHATRPPSNKTYSHDK